MKYFSKNFVSPLPISYYNFCSIPNGGKFVTYCSYGLLLGLDFIQQHSYSELKCTVVIPLCWAIITVCVLFNSCFQASPISFSISQIIYILNFAHIYCCSSLHCGVPALKIIVHTTLHSNKDGRSNISRLFNSIAHTE